MLANWLRRQWEKEEREKGYAEGRAMERGAWRYWLKLRDKWEQRRAETEREGRAFDEPPPPRPDEV